MSVIPAAAGRSDPAGEGPENPATSGGTFEIRQVSRILDLLVQELYGSDPHLALRELIQNSHDALVEAQASGAGGGTPVITVRVDDLCAQPYIEVIDQGTGMSRKDIEEKLCIVGNSDKLSSPRLDQLIGKYGIGFLSSFIVADHVQVLTRTAGAQHALLWETTDKETWKLREVDDPSIRRGTRVRLYFRNYYAAQNHEGIASLRYPDGIAEVIRQHCYLIPYPIKVEQANSEGGSRQVNAQREPWEDPQEARAMYAALFGRNEPLFTYRFNQLDPATGYEAHGVLYFHSDISTSQSAWLHVKRMLVDSNVNKLLPPYAPFVQAVVECPQLALDLARRQVQTFDAAYLWLRGVVASQYEKAFVRFATAQPDDLTTLWPNIDQTVIGRLLRELNGPDGRDKELAEAFLVATARYLPFSVVNQHFGAAGRPMWRSIHELVGDRGSSSDQAAVVHYTESNNPVEKDMLLSSHPQIIDVGRGREAHRALIDHIARYGDRFPDFELERVTASRFDPLLPEELVNWRELVGWVRDNLTFPGRSFDVQVERFDPDATSVVITDSQVDADVLTQMRDYLMDNRRAAGGAFVSQMLQVIESMQVKGSMLTIHINAKNDLMRKLRDARSARFASLAVLSVCWRAVLDYYGWNSTRDMLNREKKFTCDLIDGLLSTNDKLDETNRHSQALRDEITSFQTNVAEAEAEIERLRGLLAVADPVPEPRRDAIVGVLDIDNFVERMVGGLNAGPDEEYRYLQLILTDLSEYVEQFARVIGVTGDGLQFLIEQGQPDGFDVRHALCGLPHRLGTLAQRNPEVARLAEHAGRQLPRLRAALAYGPVFAGRLRPAAVDVLGAPAVFATRLCGMKELYPTDRPAVLVTENAVDRGTRWGIWSALDFDRVAVDRDGRSSEELYLRGIARPIRVFRPRPNQ